MEQILVFLSQIDENNNKPWFDANKASYQKALVTFKGIVEEVEQGLNQTDLIDKAKVFRIYKDVRFSKDKVPYKNNLGASFERATKMRRGGYYLHLQPGNTFAGGGFWQPEAHDLKRIRDEFVMDHKTIQKIIDEGTFKKYFDDLSREDSLKSMPRGYSADSPGINFIKLKSFVAMRKFSDKEVLSPNFSQEVVKTFVALRPFFDYMSEVLTTNSNGESILTE